eukprot:120819_1
MEFIILGLFYQYYTMFVSTKSLQEITMISQSHYDSDIGTIDQETNHIRQKPAMRIEMTRSEAEEMFKFNKYKLEIITRSEAEEMHMFKHAPKSIIGRFVMTILTNCMPR